MCLRVYSVWPSLTRTDKDPFTSPFHPATSMYHVLTNPINSLDCNCHRTSSFGCFWMGDGISFVPLSYYSSHTSMSILISFLFFWYINLQYSYLRFLCFFVSGNSFDRFWSGYTTKETVSATDTW